MTRGEQAPADAVHGGDATIRGCETCGPPQGRAPHPHGRRDAGRAPCCELADRNGVPVPSGLTDGGWTFRRADDFIEQYIAVCGLMTRLEDFQRLGGEVAEDLAATGVRYAEAVFTPSAHAADVDEDWFGPDRGVARRARRPANARPAPPCASPPTWSAMPGSTRAGARWRSRGSSPAEGVVALNCAGSEVAAIAPFAPLFPKPRTAGLGSVPHAGEWAGPENVWETLEHYAPDRIGHGVRSIDDPRLVETLADRRDPAWRSRRCPTWPPASYPSLEAHPFLQLRDARAWW